MFCGQHLEIRITPAWAGKSTCRASMPTVSWDHPRVGGEKKGVRHWWALPRGSPPRWRGKATFSGRSDPGVGITPAWAGKSRSGVTMDLISRDHPRVGGEKARSFLASLAVSGSPPRGRGKVLLRILRVSGVGITPAWAGKRGFCNYDYYYFRDHPRVGGEKIVSVYYHTRAWGSPPRGRGKGIYPRPLLCLYRITPAWAGKRLSIKFVKALDKDHPRVGGEKRKMLGQRFRLKGSPPRGRGKVLHW